MKTKQRIASVLKYLITLSIAFGLLWYAFRGISLSQMIGQLSEVDFVWIYLSIFISIFSHLLRAYRWQILLEPLDYKVTLNRSFWAVMIGYLANLAFPRMGEITKCSILKKTNGVKISRSMGTVVTERIFDVIALLFFIGITFGVEFDRLNQFFIDLVREKLPNMEEGIPFTIVLWLILGIVAFLSPVYIWRDKIFKSALFAKIKEALINFQEGLLSIRKIQNIPGFLLSTIGIWVFYYLMSYLIVFSIPETQHLDWQAGLAILVVGGIAMSAPVQGGIGTYHFLIAALLTLYGVNRNEGVFFATLLHTSQTLSVLFFGVLGIIIVSFLKKTPVES